MDFISSKKLKTAIGPSQTSEYKPLTQSVSDDDDDDDDNVIYMDNDHKGDLTPTELYGLGIKPGHVKNSAGVRLRRVRCNCFRICCFVSVLISVFVLLGAFLLYLSKPHAHSFNGTTTDWFKSYYNYGTETCVRLVDVDDDGRQDVIFTMSSSVYFEDTLQSRESSSEYCKLHDEEYPCVGRVVALRGYDGAELYRVHTHSNPFEINCDAVDINKDGKKDCIVTGRLGTLTAFNPKNGHVFWRGDGSYLYDFWNTYNALALNDFDGDGVEEILIAQGGDPQYAPTVTNRRAGRLIVLNGATGRMVGDRFLSLPESKETYMSPALHQRKDGSQYVLFGHGGETVPGSFLIISLPDLMRYVKGLRDDAIIPNTRGKYTHWKEKYLMKGHEDKHILEIYRSETKGVMVTPLLIDLNGDGVKDIFLSAYDGRIILFDGETLKSKDIANFPGYESYSSPAPGYFNDDNTIDVMMHFAYGSWPAYEHSLAVILDTKDGTILWSKKTHWFEMTSPLVLKTTERHRDVFLYRVQGRRPPGTRDRRQAGGDDDDDDRQPNDEDYWYLQNSTGVQGDQDMNMDSVDVVCTDDLNHMAVEIFVMDRTVMTNPIKVNELAVEKYSYNTSTSKKIIGSDDRPGLNGQPPRRKKRHFGHSEKGHDDDDDDDIDCVVLKGDERSTGSIGDVDGDGELDYVMAIEQLGGPILNSEHEEIRDQYVTKIIKINLSKKIQDMKIVPMEPVLAPGLKTAGGEKKIKNVGFRPLSQQPWLAYMGTKADSTFPSDKQD